MRCKGRVVPYPLILVNFGGLRRRKILLNLWVGRASNEQKAILHGLRLTMTHRIALWMSALLIGTLAMTGAASAYGSRDSYGGRDLRRTQVCGVVERIVGQEAYLRTDDGTLIGMQLGPESYWDERGYRLWSGSRVTADCWYDPYGRSEWYYAASIWGPGFSIWLTNDDGVPYWVTADDFYYDNYGPCGDTYIIWYDCTPTFYIYLPLPPRYYTCYYGPRWRHHWNDWHTRWYRHHDRHDGDWRGPAPRQRDWGRDRSGSERRDYNGNERRDRGHDGGNYNKGKDRRKDAPPPQKVKQVEKRREHESRKETKVYSGSKSNSNQNRRGGRR